MRGLAKFFGYSIIKNKRHPTLASHLKKVIQTYDINVIIDVGANCGQFAQLVRKAGYSGTIHSFEPVDYCFDQLSKISKDDQMWKIHKLGAGSEATETEINVSKGTSFSSLLPANQFGKARFDDIEQTHKQKIKIMRLDDVLADTLGDKNARVLLKSDTQGYDLEVFAGIKKFQNRVACVLVELSFIPIYDGMSNQEHTLRELIGNGFSVSGMYPVTRNKDLSLIEMDCMLVNREMFGSTASGQ